MWLNPLRGISLGICHRVEDFLNDSSSLHGRFAIGASVLATSQNRRCKFRSDGSSHRASRDMGLTIHAFARSHGVIGSVHKVIGSTFEAMPIFIVTSNGTCFPEGSWVGVTGHVASIPRAGVLHMRTIFLRSHAVSVHVGGSILPLALAGSYLSQVLDRSSSELCLLWCEYRRPIA